MNQHKGRNLILLSFLIVALAFWIARFKSIIDQAGILRSVSNLNNQRCERIKGLEACEDIFIDHSSGLSYLACSRLNHRSNWLPALDILNIKNLASRSPDYVALLNLKTREYRKLDLVNQPDSITENGLNLHGIDLFIEPDDDSNNKNLDQSSQNNNKHLSPGRKATIYLINHRRAKPDGSPEPSKSSSQVDSVVEVFDTIIGSDKATYRTTIHDQNLILTPNNLVAIDHHSFYLTNDHSKRPSPTRFIQDFFLEPLFNNVVYCSFKDSLKCIPALQASYPFPNGIAKGPNRLIYMTNSMNAHVRSLEIQEDNTLKLKQEIKVPRILDNLYVTETGSIFIAAIPKLLKFQTSMNLGKLDEGDPAKSNLISPSEVWKLSNKTAIDSNTLNDNTSTTSNTNNTWFNLEKIFADDGKQVSGTTGVAVWDSKLIMTGIASPHVSICQIDQKLSV